MSEYAWSVAIPMGALVLSLLGIVLYDRLKRRARKRWLADRDRRVATLRQYAARLNPGGPVLPPQPTALYPGEKLIRFDPKDPT